MSMITAVKVSWRQEGFGMLTKGLTTRIVSVTGPLLVGVFLYENIKVWSLKDEYKMEYSK